MHIGIKQLWMRAPKNFAYQVAGMSTDWEHNVECVESELAANKASIELILICFLLFLKMIPLQNIFPDRALRGHFFL